EGLSLLPHLMDARFDTSGLISLFEHDGFAASSLEIIGWPVVRPPSRAVNKDGLEAQDVAEIRQ
ncbi:MAG: hypothetical protein KDA59_20920, partial [Planctomycetales bacterium]|nr:hypothetical protein [Planctomycetales bacterium]